MVHKILFWTGFGIAANIVRLGIEMRPLITKRSWIHYPIYGGSGASFGYWLMGVEERQQAMLAARRESLLEKRARRAKRAAAEAA